MEESLTVTGDMKKSVCFFCLNKGEHSFSNRNKIALLSRHLKIHLRKVIDKLRPSNMSKALNDTNWSPGFCIKCSQLLSNFQNLYCEQEVIRLRLSKCVLDIQNVLEHSALQWKKKREDGGESNMWEAFRKKMLIKCQASSELPHVLLKRLEPSKVSGTSLKQPKRVSEEELSVNGVEDNNDGIGSDDDDSVHPSSPHPPKLSPKLTSQKNFRHQRKAKEFTASPYVDQISEEDVHESTGEACGKKLSKSHRAGHTSKHSIENRRLQRTGPFSCRICVKNFPSRTACRQHLVYRHTSSMFLSCKPKGMSLPKFSKALHPVLNQLVTKMPDANRVKYTCNMCGPAGPSDYSEDIILLHLRGTHPDKVASKLGCLGTNRSANLTRVEPRPIRPLSRFNDIWTLFGGVTDKAGKCAFCSVTLGNVKALRRHLVCLHAEKLFTQCKAPGSSEEELMVAVQKVMDSHRKLDTCQICCKKFGLMPDCIRHILLEHYDRVAEDVVKYQEKHREQSLEVSSESIDQRGTGMCKPSLQSSAIYYECKLCQKRVLRRLKGSHSRLHQARITPGKQRRSAKCKLCHQKFVTATRCQNHIAAQHRSALFQSLKVASKSAAEFKSNLDTTLRSCFDQQLLPRLEQNLPKLKKYTCTFCGYFVKSVRWIQIVVHLAKMHYQKVGSKLREEVVDEGLTPVKSGFEDLVELFDETGNALVTTRSSEIHNYEKTTESLSVEENLCEEEYDFMEADTESEGDGSNEEETAVPSKFPTRKSSRPGRTAKQFSSSPYVEQGPHAEAAINKIPRRNLGIRPKTVTQVILSSNDDTLRESEAVAVKFREIVQKLCPGSSCPVRFSQDTPLNTADGDEEGDTSMWEPDDDLLTGDLEESQKDPLAEACASLPNPEKFIVPTATNKVKNDATAKPLFCKVCGMTFKTRQMGRYHITHAHTSSLFSYCKNRNEPQKDFDNRLKAVIKELIVSGGGPETSRRALLSTCTLCGIQNRDNSQTSMVLHLNRVHYDAVAAKLGCRTPSSQRPSGVYKFLGRKPPKVGRRGKYVAKKLTTGESSQLVDGSHFEASLGHSSPVSKFFLKRKRAVKVKRRKFLPEVATSTKTFQCRICEHRFTTAYACRHHIGQVHSSSLFSKCKPPTESSTDFADKLNSLLGGLIDKVIQNERKGTLELTCKICKIRRVSRSIGDMVLHLRKIHFDRIASELGYTGGRSRDDCQEVNDFVKRVCEDESPEVPEVNGEDETRKEDNRQVVRFSCCHCTKEFESFDMHRLHVVNSHRLEAFSKYIPNLCETELERAFPDALAPCVDKASDPGEFDVCRICSEEFTPTSSSSVEVENHVLLRHLSDVVSNLKLVLEQSTLSTQVAGGKNEKVVFYGGQCVPVGVEVRVKVEEDDVLCWKI